MIRSASMKVVLLVLSFAWFDSPPQVWGDQPITVATWNVAQIDREVSDLNTDGFLAEVPFDILFVNEVKKQDHLDSLKAAWDIEEFHTAISSFQNGTGNLEVGIISRFPLTEIVEFDRSPDNGRTGIDEEKLERPNLAGIANVGVGRGFLVAKVAALDLYLIVTHLKSSRGASGRNDDGDNARKRELVAAAIATHVQKLREDHPTCSVIVGGDFNVGVSDGGKNGTDLTNDTTDGYDDTHALMEEGLIDGLEMKSLAKNVPSTYMGNDDTPDFPGTGAIDVLYITGPLESTFQNAKATTSRFGSDHLGVYASTGNAGGGGGDGGGTSPMADTVEISNAMPNPVGNDTGREKIVLKYTGDGTADISGWKMRDAGGNIFTFGMGVTLNPGENTITLTNHTMPLNNSGDTIILFDASGVQRGPTFRYSGVDVSPGELVR